ncbi:MAG: hypothetical protein IJP66_08255 [Kiritimatiellae bacterium]|nr:hypothetical protein [Kiritimatiellia bacterium]
MKATRDALCATAMPAAVLMAAMLATSPARADDVIWVFEGSTNRVSAASASNAAGADSTLLVTLSNAPVKSEPATLTTKPFAIVILVR